MFMASNKLRAGKKKCLTHSHQIDFIQRFMFSQCKPPAHWKVINSDETGLLAYEAGSYRPKFKSARLPAYFLTSLFSVWLWTGGDEFPAVWENNSTLKFSPQPVK